MKFFIDILKGMVIGLANIIPGVSGGTMMVSMGIYDTLIYCCLLYTSPSPRDRG